MTDAPPVEARFGPLHNLTMAIVAAGMLAAALVHFSTNGALAPRLSFADPRFALFTILGLAMIFYAYTGVVRFFDRRPQVVIDEDGIELGFGRHRRFAWSDVEWVRLRRLAVRPQLQIGITPAAFLAADLRLSMLNLDDGLRPIRGVPAAILVRDNGLDMRASAMLDAVRRFRPNLVKR
jgi:hypothetical protein